jgi:hypothetical protein
MTGKVDQASLQSALYKIGYFVFLAVFLVAVLLSLRVALLRRDRVKQSHLTVSPLIFAHHNLPTSVRERMLTTPRS